MFGTAKEYTAAALRGAPPSPLARKQKSLFDELFDGELGVLHDVLDDKDNYDADERNLAHRILSGHHPERLNQDDRARLDRIALGLAGVSRAVRHQPAVLPAPRHQESGEAQEAAVKEAMWGLQDNDEAY